MSSLANCFKLHNIAPAIQKEIRDKARDYRKEGFSAAEANKGAVKDYFKEVEAQRVDMVAQIRKGIPKVEPWQVEAKGQGFTVLTKADLQKQGIKNQAQLAQYVKKNLGEGAKTVIETPQGWQIKERIVTDIEKEFAPKVVEKPKTVEAKAEEAKPVKEAKRPPVVSAGVKPQGEARKIVETSLSEIDVEPERFQPRVKGINEEVQKQRMEAFDRSLTEMDPIKVWRDPKDNRLKVLVGHHRVDLFKRMNEQTIPMIEFKGTEAEAVDYAKNEQQQREAQTPLDRANIYRNARINDSLGDAELMRRAKGLEGKNANSVVNLSYLNPKGKTLGAIEALGEEKGASSRDAMTMAEWIGGIRRANSGLSDSHENEIFDYLLENYKTKGKKHTSASEFKEFIGRIIDRRTTFGEFDAKEPLNLQNIVPASKTEQEYDGRIDDAKANLREAQRILENKRAELIKRNATPEQLDRVLKEYNDAVTSAKRELLGLEQNRADAIGKIRAQEIDLFAEIDKKKEDARNAGINERDIEAAGDGILNDADRARIAGEIRASEQAAKSGGKAERKPLTREGVKEQFEKAGADLRPEQRVGQMAMWDADAKAWVKRNPGKTVDDWYRKTFAGLQVGEAKPDNALYQYVGQNANLKDDVRQNLHMARYMERQGRSAENIRAVTGWKRNDYDNMWRYEIPGENLRLNISPKELVSRPVGVPIRAGDVMDFPELFKAYPQLRDIKIVPTNELEMGTYASASALSAEIRLNVNMVRRSVGTLELRQALAHEFQHFIQFAEGFARGSNLRKFLPENYEKVMKELAQTQKDIDSVEKALARSFPQANEVAQNKLQELQRKKVMLDRWLGEAGRHAAQKYLYSAGEIEARDVEARLELNREQRRATPPLSTENISPDQAIVLFGEATEAEQRKPTGVRLSAEEESNLKESLRSLVEQKTSIQAQYDFAKSQPRDKLSGKQRFSTKDYRGRTKQYVDNRTYGEQAYQLYKELASLDADIHAIKVQLKRRDIGAKPQEALFAEPEKKKKPYDPQMTLFQRPSNWYYSGLEKIVTDKMPNKASAEQIQAIIREAKQDEIKWTGLDEFLKTKSTFTKEEIQNFLKENEVKVEEVVKGPTPKWKEFDGWTRDDVVAHYASLTGQTRQEVERMEFATDFMKDQIRSIEQNDVNAMEPPPGAPKFSGQVLPGGKEGTYRELLLTLPTKEPVGADIGWTGDPNAKLEATINGHKLIIENDGKRFYVYEDGGRLGQTKETIESAKSVAENYARQEPRKTQGQFTGGHFDEPNVFAHIRFNERTDAQGRKTLFIEEIQSDWAQKGRREGYKQTGLPEGWKIVEPSGKIEQGGRQMWSVLDESGKVVLNATSKESAVAWAITSKGAGQVPVFPFAKNWHEVAMRRAIRWAAENGYDALAFTTGEQQAARYDLSKQVDEIGWWRPALGPSGKLSDSQRTMEITAKGGEVIDFTFDNSGVVTDSPERADWRGKKLDDVVGKDIAAKALSSEEGNLKGEGLKVGGEGMKGFYDKILVDYANKFGKKFGSRVGDVTTNLSPEGGTVEYSERRDSYVVRDSRGMQIKVLPNTEEGIKEAKETAEALRTKSRPETVHSLPITEEMKKSVMEGQPLFQKAKGAVNFLGDNRALITAFKGANISTFVHETGHIHIAQLVGEAMTGDMKALADVRTIEDWTGLKEGELQVLHSRWIDGTATGGQKANYTMVQEKYARGIERYMAEGIAPSKPLEELFQRFKEWMAEVYKSIAGSEIDVEISPEIRKVFDRYFGEEVSEVALNTLYQAEKENPIAPTKAANDKYMHDLVSALEGKKKKRKPGERKRPIVGLMRDQVGIFHLEGKGRGLRGQKLVEYVRGKLIETLRESEEYKAYSASGKLQAAKRLQTENVDRWIRFYEKSKRQVDAAKEIEERDNRIVTEVGKRIVDETAPEQSKKLLELAQRFRSTGDTQGRTFSGFWSRVSQLAKSYGAGGGELAHRMYEGDMRRDEFVRAAKPYLEKINDVYEEIEKMTERDALNTQVIAALEDRANAALHLKTEQAKEVYKNTSGMFDYFKKLLEREGYEVLDDYYTHMKDVDILDQVFDMMKDAEPGKEGRPLNDFISATSSFLKPREGADMRIVKDLPYVLSNYLRSVTRELAYKNGVQYYYERFQKDIPIALRRNNLDRAKAFMRNVLQPERGRGKFFRLINRVRSNQYRNFLGFNLKASAVNRTQVDFARMRWTKEADQLERKLWRRRENLTGALADAVALASRETPRYLESVKGALSEETQGQFDEMFNYYDPFQRSEGRNWGKTELGSILNAAIKDPRYQKLKSEKGNMAAIEEVLNDKTAFDKAIREAASTAAETQVAAAPSMRGEFYDKPLMRVIGMFTAFKFRQLQVFKETIGKQTGINGTRAQLILRRGLSGEAEPVEVLREVESNRRALERMLEKSKKTKDDIGISYEDTQRFIDYLEGQEGELNEMIRQLEPTRSPAQRAAVLAKYTAKVAGLSIAFGTLWGIMDALSREEDYDPTMGEVMWKTFLDIQPSPFYGTNPSKFLVSPVTPNLEDAMRYGVFSGRGLTRDVVQYGMSAIPYANVVDRMFGRGLSRGITDIVSPVESKPSPLGIKKPTRKRRTKLKSLLD